MSQNCVIQLEVFHVNFHNNTLEGVLQEAFDRANDNFRLATQAEDVGTGIKTVIRFYDDEDKVMKYLEKIARYRKQREVWVNAPRNNWLTNNWARWRMGKIQDKIDLKLEQIRLFAQAQLKRSQSDQTVVALEKRDYTFRPIKNNEWHDLMRSIQFGQMWIFAFEPCDLLKVKGLTSAGSYM